MSVFANVDDVTGKIVGGIFARRQNEYQIEFEDDAFLVLDFKNSLAMLNPAVADEDQKKNARMQVDDDKALKAILNLVRKQLNLVRQNPTTVYPAISVDQMRTWYLDEIT